MLTQKERQAVKRLRVDKERLLSLAVTAYIRNLDLTLPEELRDRWVPEDALIPLFAHLDTLEDFIWLSGCGLSTSRVRNEGAVYTPLPIRAFIVNQVISTLGPEDKVADLSCGSGAFLLTMIDAMRKCFPNQSLSCLFDRIHGVDIDETAIKQAHTLCLLYAASLNEALDNSCLHLSVSNALTLPNSLRYKAIIGNPPYVRLRNLPKEQVGLFGENRGTGLTDMYLVFFQLSLKHLQEGGIACLIAPNTWLTSLNGRSFRERLLSMRIAVDLYDFGSAQVFPGRSTYTCIIRMRKVASDSLHYANVDPHSLNHPHALEPYAYDTLSSDGWRMSVGRNRLFLDRVAQMSTPLLDGVVYANGIATCANDVFIFRPISMTKDHFVFKDNHGRTCQVERNSCRPIIRCSELCASGDYDTVCQQVIFPYQERTTALEEATFQSQFPLAYAYLLSHRKRLMARDKGMLTYPWFAWGRTQGFRYNDQARLIMPLMTGIPIKAYLLEKPCFIVNGFSLLTSDRNQLLLLRSILSSKVFGHYLTLTSKPYQGGFWSLMRASFSGFRIPVFNEEQRRILISGDSTQVDRLLTKLYDASWLLEEEG